MPLSLRLVDDHLDAVGELALDGEIVRRVVAVVHGRIAVLERHGMLGVGAVDLDRPHAFLVVPDGPGGDVDVVGAPVGELAARVFVPPAEIVVAALLDVVDLRRLAEPEVPIEFLRRGDLGERSARRAAVDAHGDLLDVAQAGPSAPC